MLIKRGRDWLARSILSSSLLILPISLSLGCSVAAEDYRGGDTELNGETKGPVHAIVRVRHLESQGGATRADALAGFVQIPAKTDPSEILILAGLMQQLPQTGECREEKTLATDLPTSGITEIELLDAQSVQLTTTSGVHELAPYAFPAVADLLRGVVYTSRDQNGAELPTGVGYTIEATHIGSEVLGDELNFKTQIQSPPPLAGVEVSGKTVGGLMHLPPSKIIDLSWQTDPDVDRNLRDRVAVVVQNEETVWTCSFDHAEGFGSIPLVTDGGVELANEGAQARMEVHRLRTAYDSDNSPLAHIKVTFDFALEAIVSFDQTTHLDSPSIDESPSARPDEVAELPE